MLKRFFALSLTLTLGGCFFVYTGSLPTEEQVGRNDFPLDKELFEEHEARYYECVDRLRCQDGSAHLKHDYIDKLRKCVGRPMSRVIACRITADLEYYASTVGNGRGYSDVIASYEQCLARQTDPISKCFNEGVQVAQDKGSIKQGDRTTRLCLEKLWEK